MDAHTDTKCAILTSNTSSYYLNTEQVLTGQGKIQVM